MLEPIGDPSLQIEWQHNGHAVPYSNRIHMTNDFGVATLLIKHLISEDSGEYKFVSPIFFLTNFFHFFNSLIHL